MDLLRQLKSPFLQIAQRHCTNARKNKAESQITRFILISPLEIVPLMLKLEVQCHADSEDKCIVDVGGRIVIENIVANGHNLIMMCLTR